MILKTKDFQEIANKILLATSVDAGAGKLELVTREGFLYLNVTNKEFFVSVKFPLDGEEDFHATVEAKTFLDLISKLTTPDFRLTVKDNVVNIGFGKKSNYPIPLIYNNDELLTLDPIVIQNKTVEMVIPNDALSSILNVNSKEIQKVAGLKKQNININELQELYYIDQDGCFTFTTGSCLNNFKTPLEKPINILLTDKIVKLFKLFTDDVFFCLGQDASSNGLVRTKISFQANNTYLAAIITSDDALISRVQGPVAATKRLIKETAYDYHLTLNASTLKETIERLLPFNRNTEETVNTAFVPMTVHVYPDEITITNEQGVCEEITIDGGNDADADYEMPINIIDLKLIVDSCTAKNESITLNCGNHKSVVISRAGDLINNVIPEAKRK